MITKNPTINLKYYRDLKGISQRKLAEKVQTSQGYISYIENNSKSPTVRMLYNIAYALEICPKLLLPCIIECKERNNCECELNLNEDSNIQ